MLAFAATTLLTARGGAVQSMPRPLEPPTIEPGGVHNPTMVTAINADPTASWVAELSPRFDGVSYDAAHALLGASPPLAAGDTAGGWVHWGVQTEPAPEVPIPDAFDARQHWNGGAGGFNCSTMVTVQNQGGCGSCWAFGTSESFSDRMCVASGGRIDTIFSAQEPTSCVGCMGKKAGQFNASCPYNGCNGGQTHDAWRFFIEQGLVTRDCWPYQDGTEKHKLSCNASEMVGKHCNDSSVPWKPHYAKEGSIVALNNVTEIKAELLANGPVSTQFKVYDDFFHYKSGVYNGCSPPANQSRHLAGYHAVKIVGWGSTDIDPTLDYWTVQNSWGPTWGMDGYFNMVMDFTDQFNVSHSSCGIGTGVIVGQADVARTKFKF